MAGLPVTMRGCGLGIGWFAFFASKAGCDCVAYVVPFSRRSLYECGGTGESLGGSPGDNLVVRTATYRVFVGTVAANLQVGEV